MLIARANGTDPVAAVERTIGWQRLEEMVEVMDQNPGGTRADNLAEVIEGQLPDTRIATIILGGFTFRSWKSTDSLLTALEVLSINPIRQNESDVDDIARGLYSVLPRLRITELLAEVHQLDRFCRAVRPPAHRLSHQEDSIALT